MTCAVFSLGMYALRERRQHVTQEDLELAVAKVLKRNMVRRLLFLSHRSPSC